MENIRIRLNHLNKGNMFLEVIKAQYVNEYRIKLWFNNGEMRMVDLKDSLNGPVFQPLKDLDFFKKFAIRFNTIEWPNEADFAP